MLHLTACGGIGGSIGTLTGGAASGAVGIANWVGGQLQNPAVQDTLGSFKVLSSTIGAVLAPFSGVLAVGGIMAGGSYVKTRNSKYNWNYDRYRGGVT